MTWLNPWAWIGLAALAVPVAIHLLTRAQPRPQPFPTLRFLHQTASTALRRRTITDRALLGVRCACLAAVVAALAQPATRRPIAGESAPVVRAVVIDAGIGDGPAGTDSRRAIDVARDRAAHLEPAAADRVSIETTHLPSGIARAATWLAERGGRDELVVISPFRRGAIEATDLTPVGSGVGIRLIKIDVSSTTQTTTPAWRVDGQAWTPHVTLDADRTSVSWSAAPAADAAAPFLRVMAAPGDRGDVAALLRAASVVGVPVAGPHAIAIVLPDAPDRAAATADAGPLDEPWMFDAADRLRRDSVLAAAAARIAASAGAPVKSSTTLARDVNGVPVVEAASGPTAPGRELRLFARSGDRLLLTALAAGAARAEIDRSALNALEPITVTTDELNRWQRPMPATGAAPTALESGAWQGRWLWIAVLALLGIESWVRRSTRPPASVEVTHARVA